MTARITKALFAFIVGLFVIAVIVFGALVAAQYHWGQKNARRDFKIVLNSAASVFERNESDPAAIKLGMENVFAAHENLAAITIRIDNTPVFAQQASLGFISLSANNEPIITAAAPMLLTLSAVFTAVDGKPALTSAAFYILKPKAVYNAARVSFLIILAATVIAILFVLVSQFSPGVERVSTEAAKDESSNAENADAKESHQAANAPPTQKAAESKEIAADAEKLLDAKETLAAREFTPIASSADESSLERIGSAGQVNSEAEAPEQGASPSRIITDISAQQKNPNNISPTTGFTWGAFLETRLEAELERATELELDVALFIILLPNLAVPSSPATEIFKLITHQFRFSDYIFEYKAYGIAAIVLNSTIDDSIKQAERLYVKLTELAASESLELQFGIGVSNRTFRIISAERLIGEADEAAHRALESPETPIVALKIDPAKYREFLSKANDAPDENNEKLV
jgi:hypothetical protein